ncbi:MAG: hypothetical protein IT323_19595 [Anaerolineae bacterium]|nr:hypothetical protein [Anaerolineae bacterium]
MPDLKLFLFGRPHLDYQGEEIPFERQKALAVAAYLALSPERQSRDTLAALLWTDLDHEHARAAFRSTLSAMTRPVPVRWVASDRLSVALDRACVWIDVNQFLARLAQIRAHGHESDVLCADCLAALQDALALYRADLLAGFNAADSVEYDEWQSLQQEWLRREYAGALRRLAAHFFAVGQLEPAIDAARQWLAVDSLDEAAHRLLMQLYAVSGRRAEALRQYQHCVSLLETELATPPEEATTQLYQEIAGGKPPSPRADQPTPGIPTGVLPPLPSLMVGRDATMADLRRRLGADGDEGADGTVMRPLTLIQGWPGVGKSTIVARLAHHAAVAARFPDGVLWASLGETPNLLKELLGWAEAFHLREAPRLRRIEDVSAQLAAVLHDRRVLILLDDVWKADHVMPFRVGGAQCAMILTTRLNEVAVALAPTAPDILRLPVLDDDSGFALLSQLAPEIVQAQPDAARRLVRDLEGLPLAIQVAGRLLHSEAHLGWGVSELLAELHSGAALLQAAIPGEMLVPGYETPPTIAALLRRSTDLLDGPSRLRFALLGLFVPKPAVFDLKAMAAAWDVADPKPTARLLVSRGLLEPVSGGRFQLHALLVAHARTLLNEAAGR